MPSKKTPATPVTTTKLNNQHDYITLTVKCANGDTYRYTTSYGGERMSGTTASEWAKADGNFNAVFKAFQAVTCKLNEKQGERMNRLAEICRAADSGVSLLRILQESATSQAELAAIREQSFRKYAPRDDLPGDAFGKTVLINARGKGMTPVVVHGFSEKGTGKVDLKAENGDTYEVEPKQLRALLQKAGIECPAEGTWEREMNQQRFATALVDAPTVAA